MYLGVDIGGTKTLVAVLDNSGVITERSKFPTPKTYHDLLASIRAAGEAFSAKDFEAGGVGVPGRINRTGGTSLGAPNISWGMGPLQADLEKIFHCPFVIENDANMAGLSEAMLHKEYATVLYITVSTGIGTGVVRNQKLEPALINSEGGQILLPFKEQYVPWEKFASGKAIYEHFGKKAADITAVDDWKYIARNLSLGTFDNIAIIQPDLVIIGGSIGSYFEKYGEYLVAELKKYEMPAVPIPPILKAQRPEEAVIYGCYDLARDTYGKGR
jgi:glucokinase